MQAQEVNKQALLKAILIAGLLAGTLDIIAAIAQTVLADRDPIKMFKFIASGVFGKTALEGGNLYAALGLFFHFCIATGWTALFYLIFPRINFFGKNWIVTGIIYGTFVWLMMNRVVLPLSNTPPIPFKFGWNLVKSWMTIVIAVGLPISYLASKYFKQESRVNVGVN